MHYSIIQTCSARRFPIMMAMSLLAIAQLQADETSADSVKPAIVNNAQAGETSKPASPYAQPLRDPFQASHQRVGDPIYPVGPKSDGETSFGELELKGIFIMEGYPASAIVQAGGKDGVRDIVSVGDLIPLPIKGNAKNRSMKVSDQRYLLVVDIQPNSIIVAPKASPEEHITIR